MKSNEMVIFTRTFDLMAWLLDVSKGFPRDVRHSYTARLLDAGFRLREHLEEANLRQVGERKARLVLADDALAHLKFYIRLGVRMAFLKEKQYEHAMPMLAEVGRLLGGWIKA